jgi:hydroxymethylpyrimidine/phosphomethylpyrimidine kinase
MAREHARACGTVSRPRVLVIAGSDSSGGAGLLRDVQVLSEFGVDTSCAITSVTAQTDHRVASKCVLSAELVREQVRTALECGPIHAIKIGMLASGVIVAAVSEVLPASEHVPIVLDPVLVSSSGTSLLDAAGVIALKEQLFSRCTLITPNLMEAATLLGKDIAGTTAAMLKQAEELLLRFGPAAVLLKGGHANDPEALDILLRRSAAPVLLRAERLNVSLRGTGCALSSAIAASLASGMPLHSACRRAKDYMHYKLAAASEAIGKATADGR